MDGTGLGVWDGTGLINGVADYIDDTTEGTVADGHRNWPAGVDDVLAAHEPFARIHRDGAHGGFAEMLGNFEHQSVTLIVGLQRIEDGGEVAFELDVDNSADDLSDMSYFVVHELSWL